MGDTNCDLNAKKSEQPKDNDYTDILHLYGLFSFKQLIAEPSRTSLTTSSITDHVSTTCARNMINSGVHEVSLSDHFMVYRIRNSNGGSEGP